MKTPSTKPYSTTHRTLLSALQNPTAKLLEFIQFDCVDSAKAERSLRVRQRWTDNGRSDLCVDRADHGSRTTRRPSLQGHRDGLSPGTQVSCGPTGLDEKHRLIQPCQSLFRRHAGKLGMSIVVSRTRPADDFTRRFLTGSHRLCPIMFFRVTHV